MEISIFQAMGPVMIGPSSSHTAGAARLARIASKTLSSKANHVSFGLHGSFAKTYKGHGTDKALVAGVLGFSEDDARLRNSFEIAEERGLSFDFYETNLSGVHENSVKMTFTLENGETSIIFGSSIGGGEIIIWNIDGFDTELNGLVNTIMTVQKDEKGIVHSVSGVLFEHGLNIAAMKLSRKSKGETAVMLIETDGHISDEVINKIIKNEQIISAKALNITEGEVE